MRQRPPAVTTAVAAACAAGLLAGPAAAQSLLKPVEYRNNQKVSCGGTSEPASEAIGKLRDLYYRGEWESLQSSTRALLATCALKPEADDPHLFVEGNPSRRPNYSRDWYAVVLATVDADDEPVVIRYIVREPIRPPYSTTMLDIPAFDREDPEAASGAETPRFVQVFLAPTAALELETLVQATPTSNPVVDQIADVLKATIDPAVVLPLFKGMVTPSAGAAADRADAPGSATPPVSRVRASFSRIRLPFDRGEYKIGDALRARPTLDEEGSLRLRGKFTEFVESAKKSAASTPDGSSEKAAAELSAALEKSAAEYLRKPETILACNEDAVLAVIEDPDASKASKEMAASLSGTCFGGLAKALDDAYKVYCPEARPAPHCGTDRLELVLLRFKDAAKAQPAKPVKSSSAVNSLPRQRLSFGVVSAYIVGASTSDDRVKVDGGDVVADPLGRSLNAVVVNVHAPFDATAREMERAERLRAFAGVTITPNFGIAVGGAFAPLRNLSINAGYALLFIPTLRGGDTLNEPPSDGRRPFDTGLGHAAFLGLGYKFGK